MPAVPTVSAALTFLTCGVTSTVVGLMAVVVVEEFRGRLHQQRVATGIYVLVYFALFLIEGWAVKTLWGVL